MIPEFPPALAGFLRLETLALEVLLEGNAFGLGDVHRFKCYTDKRVWVKNREEAELT